MGQKPGDDGKHEPSLELPSLKLPGARRRKKEKRPSGRRVAGRPAENGYAEPEAPSAPDAPTHAPPVYEAPAYEPPAYEPPQPLPTEPVLTEPETAQPLPTTSRRAETRSSRSIPAGLAVVLTGLLVGGLGTGLTYLGLQGCETLTGTDSCGGAPGLLLLVAILALMVLFGSIMLKLFRVSEPGSTSFLAVGIVTVVALVGLLDVIFSAWMFAVMPALGAVAYALSRWVTTRFAAEPQGPEPHDVR